MRRSTVVLAVAFVAGMVAAIEWGWGGIAIGSVVVGGAWYGIMQGNEGIRLPVFLVSMAFLIGAGLYEIKTATLHTTFPLTEGEHTVRIAGIIVQPIAVDGDRLTTVVQVHALDGANVQPWKGRERVRLTMRLQQQQELAVVGRWQRGDRFEATGVLQRPLPATNFDGFDYARYLKFQEIFWTFQLKGTSAIAVHPVSTWSWIAVLAVIDTWRMALVTQLRTLYTQPVVGFMEGMVVGIRDAIAPEQYAHFSQLGLTHLLAISGLNVALYVGAILLLLRLFPLTQETRYMIALWAVVLFILMTGASPSVVRAGMMAMVALYAARRHALHDGIHLVAVVAVLMLGWNPLFIHDVSFQLSFIVTIGLIVGVPTGMRLLPRGPLFLRTSVAVTLVAQLASFPLTITYFNGFSLLSFLANLCVVPLYSFVVLPLGVCSVVFSAVWTGAGQAVAMAVSFLVETSFRVFAWAVDVQGMYTIWATPSWGWVALYYGVCIALLVVYNDVFVLHARRRMQTLCLLGCSGVAVVIGAYGSPWGKNGEVMVSFLDVGQGDAILIRTATGKHILLDSGGTVSFLRPTETWRKRQTPYDIGQHILVPLLQRRGVKQLDAVVMTHGDGDHLGGMPAVIGRIPIVALYFNGTVKDTPLIRHWLQEVVQKNIPLVALQRGDVLHIDESLQFHVLHPPDPDPMSPKPSPQEKQNEYSLVLLAHMLSHTFLFTGDIGGEQEENVAIASSQLGVMGTIDVLKVAHHGSKSSTSLAMLQRWKPRMAVVSAGRNNQYGHPHPTVVARLTRQRIRLYRTDQHGEVQFRMRQGGALEVRTKQP